MRHLRNTALKIVGKLYAWLGDGVEEPCEYEFRCRDYHEKCQATVDYLRAVAKLKNIIQAGSENTEGG